MARYRADMPTISGHPRRVLLADGVATWLFPTLTDPIDAGPVLDALRAADDQLDHLGQLLGASSGDVPSDLPPYRLTYYRLGPAPRFPTTELISEGWSDEVSVLVRLWVPQRTVERVGPPWTAGAWIELPCDVDPATCSGHLVEQWTGRNVNTPIETARQVQAAADWALEQLTTQSPSALRAHDPKRGHPVPPRRSD
jgi:hypothetical protein